MSARLGDRAGPVSAPVPTPRPRPAGARAALLGRSGPRPSDVLAAFCAAGIAMLAAAAVALVVYAAGGDEHWRWLALHLALLGGVSQLILGAAQFFVCAFLATDPPTGRATRVHLAVWNGGVVLVAAGYEAGVQPLADMGALLIAVGLVLLAASFRRMQHASTQTAYWAVRWYQGGTVALAIGVVAGALLVHGSTWSHGSLTGAHMVLNLGGWIGAAIVGTLHTFFPSLTGTQLRFARLQRPAFVLWLGGVALLALATAFTWDAVAAFGWLALTAAALALAVNVAASLRGRKMPPSLPVLLIAPAQVFLAAGLLLALIASVTDGAPGPLGHGVRPSLAVLLVAGWVGLTVAGSLIHLLGMVAHVRRFTFGAAPARTGRDRAAATLAAVAVAAWAVAEIPGSAALDEVALVLRLAAVVVLAVLVGEAGARVVKASRPAAPR